MTNAAKYRKKAAEFEQLKQIDRAIASFVRAIEESESEGEDVDVALLNKVGDLSLRQGRVPDAVTYYERAVEHYATAGLFNNAIALCNKILRNAPGRSNVYFTLGRICGRKGLRGDASRNFLEYASRMQQEGRLEEAMRALSEIAELMPELTEVSRLVEAHAARAGVQLPRRRTPSASPMIPDTDVPPYQSDKSSDLVFLDVDYLAAERRRTPLDVGRVDAAPNDAIPTHPTPAAPGTAIPTPATSPSLLFIELAEAGDTLHVPELELAAPSLRAIDSVDVGEIELIDLDTTALDGTDVSDVASIDLPLMDLEPIELPLIEGTDAPTPASSRRTTPTPHRHVSGPPSRPPLRSLEIPSIEAAIEAGALLAARIAADTTTPQRRPPYRLDPHDFILPGELPPLLIDDDLVNAGLDRAIEREVAAFAAVEAAEMHADATAESTAESVRSEAVPTEILPADAPARLATPTGTPLTPPLTTPLRGTPATPEVQVTSAELATPVIEHSAAFAVTEPFREPAGESEPRRVAAPSANTSDSSDVELDAAVPDDAVSVRPPDAPSIGEPSPIAPRSAVRLTPALPIAAVAAEAKTVAESRRDELRVAVAAEPRDWALRRRLAEALFEAGQRDAGLAEMEASLTGFAQGGQIETAADLSEVLVRIAPDRVAYHQKRVEFAVRLKDLQRLRFAYLDLADTLVRSGEEGRALAVYARVLEIDPRDDRARAALGSAAPPLPAPAAAPVADGFVNLADWLRDDDGLASTRMRIREPEVSGDERADFAALLRHFKEGVSRSLGEEDYESRYDLGVAFKEMGLLDDAIAEFQKALRSKAHRLPAYEALGQCFVEQGRFQIAATVLSRALYEPGLNDEQRIGVLYLLAYSCEALQRWGEARSYFQRVYATDINFRDVAARMAALEQVAS